VSLGLWHTEGEEMRDIPRWAWILLVVIIILLVLALTGDWSFSFNSK
jgi:flagellar basal body-associated protein FliL